MNAFLMAFALSGHLAAPVYVHHSDNVLKRVGTYIYRPSDEGFRILYCMATPPSVFLACIVRTPSDKLVLIDVVASEAQT